MNPWFLLFVAIVSEVIGSNCLKASEGFTKPFFTGVSLLTFVFAFYLLSVIVRSLPLATVYAIWSGAGIVLTSVVAFFVFGQKPDLPGMLGIALIILGVLILNLFSQNTMH